MWLPILAGAVLIARFVRHALRADAAADRHAPVRRPALRASALTTLLFGSAFFGAMLLLPLYYQIVRGESALDAGLLLAPQGIGAAIAMPIAGRLTDRTGAGRIVLVGLALVTLGDAAVRVHRRGHARTGCSARRCSSAASGWARR